MAAEVEKRVITAEIEGDEGSSPKQKSIALPNILPEFISLLANVADIFMESALRLYIVQAACEHLHPYSTSCTDSNDAAKAESGVQVICYFN